MFIKCNCCCSIAEINWDEDIKAYHLTMWKRHDMSEKMSFKERLRWCWNTLKTGNPWSDHTIISEEDFEKLRSYKGE